MRPCFLVPVKWRLPECARTILPVAVNLKRLAAPRWVFNFLFGLVEFLGIARISPTNVSAPARCLSWLRRLLRTRFCCRRALFGCEQRHQNVAFHARHSFNLTVLADLAEQARHLRAAHFLVRHLAPAMENHGAHFVPLTEEPDDLILANLIVVLRGSRPKLYFLQLRPAAALALLMGLLVLLVKKFAVVGDLANRRIRRRRDFHQVQSPFPRHSNGLEWLHSPKLGTLLINHPDFASPNPLIYPRAVTL